MAGKLYTRCLICRSLMGERGHVFRVYKWQSESKKCHCKSRGCPWCMECSQVKGEQK